MGQDSSKTLTAEFRINRCCEKRSDAHHRHGQSSRQQCDSRDCRVTTFLATTGWGRSSSLQALPRQLHRRCEKRNDVHHGHGQSSIQQCDSRDCRVTTFLATTGWGRSSSLQALPRHINRRCEERSDVHHRHRSMPRNCGKII
jgi:hypothetical protein